MELTANAEKQVKNKHDKKINYLLSHIPQIASANLFISLVLVVVLWGSFSKYHLLSWLLAIYLITLIRWPLCVYLYQKSQLKDKHRYSEIAFIVFSFLSGCVWGMAGIIFIDPERTIQTAIVVLALMGMMSGAAASLSAMYSVYLAFSVMAWVPLTIHLFMIGGAEYYTLGAMAVFYVITILGHSRQMNRLVSQSISLQFENLELIDGLRAQKDLAERANTDKSRFLAAASHDLRQPLHTLNLFIDVLNNRLKKPDEKEILAYVLKSSTELSELFNALLDISKLDAGVIETNKTDFRLQPLIDKVVKDFKSLMDKNLPISVVKTKAVVNSDPIYLDLILRNLIGNAIQHTQSGRVLIGCRHRKKRGEVDIQIIDTGSGIPDTEIDNIFTEFYQIGNPERDRSKGHGLGLSIVKRLMVLLGHKLKLQTVVGKGSQFNISVEKGDENKIIEKNSSDISISSEFSLQGLNVLAIDDETAILKGLRAVLNSWGCHFSAAESLNEAKLILKSTQPDIMLVDYRLRRNENGLDLIAELQNFYDKPIPSILITGDTGAEHMLKTKASGMFVLHKPVKPAQLRLAITRVLQCNAVVAK